MAPWMGAAVLAFWVVAVVLEPEMGPVSFKLHHSKYQRGTIRGWRGVGGSQRLSVVNRARSLARSCHLGGLVWAEKEGKPKPKPKVGSVRMAKWRVAYGGMEWDAVKRLSEMETHPLGRLSDNMAAAVRDRYDVFPTHTGALCRRWAVGASVRASRRRGVKASRPESKCGDCGWWLVLSVPPVENQVRRCRTCVKWVYWPAGWVGLRRGRVPFGAKYIGEGRGVL